MSGLSRVGRVYDEKDSMMSKDLRYWLNAEDVPTGVLFQNARGRNVVWVSLADGTRALYSSELVPVKWGRKVERFDDPGDVAYALEFAPFFEVADDE